MKTRKRYCQALDLVDDEQLIKEYEKMHETIWPEVAKHIQDAGIVDMQIWRIGIRLFMIMDVDDTFSFEKMAKMERNNSIIPKWEEKMWKYQKATPWAEEGQKWVLMDKIFDLKKQNKEVKL